MKDESKTVTMVDSSSSGNDNVPNNFIAVQCDMEELGAISEPWTHMFTTVNQGVWLKDPEPLRGEEEKVFLISSNSGSTLKDYRNYDDFIAKRRAQSYALPKSYSGTGFVVYNNSFYYTESTSQRHLSPKISLHKYDIKQNRIVATHEFGVSVYKYYFSVGRPSAVNVEADEKGLWAVYSTPQDEGYMVISKLNPVDLTLMRTWRTNHLKSSVGNVFFICGVMYAVNSHNTRSAHVIYSYDTNTGTERYLTMPFAIKYGLLSQLSYNHREKVLFGYDNQHLVTYPLLFKPITADNRP